MAFGSHYVAPTANKAAPEPLKSSPSKDNNSASKAAPSKLFKGSATNPFAKRNTTSGGGLGIGNAAGANASSKPDGLFYPNAQKSSDPPGQFSSIGSFGAGKDKNTTTPAANKSDSLR